MAHPLASPADFHDDAFAPPAPQAPVERRRAGRRATPTTGLLRWVAVALLAVLAVGLQLAGSGADAPLGLADAQSSARSAPGPTAGPEPLDEGVAYGLLQAVRGGR